MIAFRATAPIRSRCQVTGSPASPNQSAMPAENTTFERHYRIGELAELWHLGRETIRKLCVDEPGIIKIRMGRKKSHTTYSIPASVAQRIHTKLLNEA